ncbi:hypothetical protein [Corynebacterium glyciniphilum]|uniref:hypothetical protein n=1 Tax=Corynebacterium glyciniphilum TaxID=1404244 RepID=UPI003FD1ACC1
MTRTGNEKYVTDLRRGPQPPEPDMPDYVAELTGQRGMRGLTPDRLGAIVDKMYND